MAPMEDVKTCELCGHPMPEGEEMFKFHGLNGPCPSPPLRTFGQRVVVEYVHRNEGGKFWLDIIIDRTTLSSIDFDTNAERQAAHEDMMQMLRSTGATDHPRFPQ